MKLLAIFLDFHKIRGCPVFVTNSDFGGDDPRTPVALASVPNPRAVEK
jgi:hypothetical protein